MLVLREVSRPLGGTVLLDQVSVEFAVEPPTAVVGLAPPEREAFLRLLEGVDRPRSGTVRLGGEDVGKARRRKGRIVRVGPNGVRGLKAGPETGPERIRLAAVAAAGKRPGLVLLDCPTMELGSDTGPEARAELVAVLGKLGVEAGAVVVLVGAPEEAVALGGNVVVLVAGVVAAAGPVEVVVAAPVSLPVAVAMSVPVLNTVAMTVRDGAGVLPDGSVFQPPPGLRLPAAGTCTLAFRPDDARPERKDAACVRFIVRAADKTVEAAGRRYARVAFANASWLTPEPPAAPAPGMMLNAFVDRSRLMVFDAEGKAVR